MPRYFFDIDDGESQFRDEDGMEMPHLEAARDEAVRVLPDVAREVLPDGDRRTFASVVRNETGDVVFRATLSLVAEWMGPSRATR